MLPRTEECIGVADLGATTGQQGDLSLDLYEPQQHDALGCCNKVRLTNARSTGTGNN